MATKASTTNASATLPATAAALMQAHLAHILNKANSLETIQAEAAAVLAWLDKKTVKDIVTEERLQQFAKAQVLGLPLNSNFVAEVVDIIQLSLDHPLNKTTLLGDIIPDESVTRVAKYFSEQQKQREVLIHELFHNPTYVNMLSQTISHAISDYMQNNPLTKNVPGVGSLMKFGKGVLEKATSSNLDNALEHYLNKNINNLTAVSERMANRHLSNSQVFTLIEQSWSKIKKEKLSVARVYATTNTVTETSDLICKTWDHLRATDYIAKQVEDGISGWYKRNQKKSVTQLLADFNIDKALILDEIKANIMPIVRQMTDDGFLAKRIEPMLAEFYGSKEALALFKD